MADVAARIHIKFVMSGDDIVKQINAITSAIKDSGVSARAIADIFSAASKRAAEEAKAAAAVKVEEIKKEMAASQSLARQKEADAKKAAHLATTVAAANAPIVAAIQAEQAAANEKSKAEAALTRKSIADINAKSAAERTAATNARTAAMEAARMGRKKGIVTPSGVPDAGISKTIQEIQAGMHAVTNGMAKIRTGASNAATIAKSELTSIWTVAKPTFDKIGGAIMQQIAPWTTGLSMLAQVAQQQFARVGGAIAQQIAPWRAGLNMLVQTAQQQFARIGIQAASIGIIIQNKLSPPIVRMVQTIKSAMSQVATAIQSSKIYQAIQPQVQVVAQYINTAFNKASVFAQTAFSKMGAAFKGVAVPIIAGAAQIGAGLARIGGAAAKSAVGGIVTALKSIDLSGLKSVVTILGNIGATIGKTALNAVKNIAKAIISIPLAPLKMLKNAFGDVGRIIAGMLGFQGLKALGRNISELTKQAGPIEALRVQFENFMQQARYNTEGFTASSKELIAEMQRMTGGALDVTTMLKSANLAFALIGDQVGKDLPKLMGIAQAAALSTGQSVDYMMESLARGIGRLSTRWIDNTGISIDATEAYKEYGKEIGKAHNELTQAERIQAMLNATMREGEQILLKTGNVTVFLQTQMARFTANLKNIRDGVMAAFAPFATVALMYINEFTSQATPKIVDWSEGFVRQFASIPPKIAPAMQALIQAGTLTGQAAQYAADGMESAQMTMGRSASDWAVNALTWGANVGSQFAIGIMNGFGMFISTVMNFISSVLTGWLAPGSPPKVVPYIDKWGEETMGEWVKGMLDYPIHDAFPQIKEDLRALLDQDVKDNLFQWGVDSIAEWAKGLSTIDLEFLSQSIEFAFNKAKRLNEELTRSYKSQKSELFKLQVLNRDPAAIRAQIKKVTTTKKSLDANEIQLRQLEMQKELIQEQLELFRLLARAIKESSERSKKGKEEKGGDGVSPSDMLDSMIQLPLAGTSDLEKKIAGIKDRLKEIFEDPLKNMKDSFTENAALIGASFTTLKDTIAEVMPVAREKFAEFTNKMSEFGATLKAEFQPDLLSFKESLVESGDEIMKAIEQFKKAGEASETTKGIFFTILHVILAVINGIFLGFGQLIAGIIRIGAGIKQVLAGDIGGGIIEILRGIAQGIFSTIGAIFIGIAEVISKLFGTTWGQVTAVWANNWEMLKKIVAGVGLNILESILALFDNVVKAFENTPLGQVIEKIFPGIDLSAAGEEGRALGREFINKAREELFGGQPEIAASSQTLINAAISGVANNTAGISQSVQGVVNSMLPDTALSGSSLIQGWIDVGASIPAGIATGISNEQTDLMDSINQLFLPIITNQSTGMGDGAALIGEQFVDNLSGTIVTQAPDLSTAMSELGAIVSTDANASLLEAGQSARDGFIQGIGGIEEWAEEAAKIFDNALSKSFTGEGVSIAYTLGKDLSHGVRDGIYAEQSTAETAMSELMTGTLETAKTTVGAQSPATKFIAIARDIVDGLALGIQRNSNLAISSMQRLMNSIVNTVSGYTTAASGAMFQVIRAMINAAISLVGDERNQTGFFAIGIAIADGIKNGIEWKIATLIAYMRETIRGLLEVMNTELGIASPSKKTFAMGQYMVEGMAGGLSGMEGVIGEAMSTAARAPNLFSRGETRAARTVTVQVNAPIVGTMMVPNMVVGREMSRQISRDISDMATLKRQPA